MAENTYRGLVVRESGDGKFNCAVENLTTEGLPAGDVLVRVQYSSLNYKDMLSATGNRGVTRKYPHTPGIDGAGTVEQSTSSVFKPGEEVIVTSYDLGMNTSGGLGQYIRVPASWVVKKPDSLSMRESMIFGTAGFTAGLSVFRLVEHGIKPGSSVLVTGATGGVGSLAVSILSHAGYRVTAVNGLVDETAFLESIGASEVIPIPDTADSAGRPMLKEQWDAAVDTVGGDMLVFALKSVKADGAVTCCGNAASADISLTVYPFILRGVTLFGIDSQNCPMDRRTGTWNMLAGAWKFPWLEKLASEDVLDGVIAQIDKIRSGKHKGRIIVNMQD